MCTTQKWETLISIYTKKQVKVKLFVVWVDFHKADEQGLWFVKNRSYHSFSNLSCVRIKLMWYLRGHPVADEDISEHWKHPKDILFYKSLTPRNLLSCVISVLWLGFGLSSFPLGSGHCVSKSCSSSRELNWAECINYSEDQKKRI